MKFLVTFFIVIIFYSYAYTDDTFRSGNEVLLSDYKELLAYKNIAVITNKTGVNQNGKHIIDMLLDNNYNVKKIFTPEHGFNADDISSKNTDIPIISLYGNQYAFTESDVSDIDVIIFDIQELGVRFYTYTSTLYLNMIAAKNFNKIFLVCDKPSIANPDYIGGFMLDDNFSSFVGKIPAPLMYGMTIGELTRYLNSEYVNYDNITVINMEGYKRNFDYESLINFWINSSPSITSIQSAKIYPALCFIEGTNISEGRGTDIPFQVFGAPDLNTKKIIEILELCNVEGVKFEEITFMPLQEKLPSYTSMKFQGIQCNGIKIVINDFKKFKPIECSIAILCALADTYDDFKWINNNFIDKLAGTNKLRLMIDNKNDYSDIILSFKPDLEKFNEIRKKYLQYD